MTEQSSEELSPKTGSPRAQAPRAIASPPISIMRDPLSWYTKLNHFLNRDSPVSALPTIGEIPKDGIFVPIQVDDHILGQIPISDHHPVPRTGIVDNSLRTLHTNKFYANAFLGGQNQPIYTYPYTIWWGKGIEEQGVLTTWGMNVSHTEEKDLEYGPGEPAKFYSNPRKQCLILSARELDSRTILTTEKHLPFSVSINLRINNVLGRPKMCFPVVQGMGFVTATYWDATPVIQTGGRGFFGVGAPIKVRDCVKYRIKDFDGRSWLVYVKCISKTQYDAANFVRIDANTLLGPPGFRGSIQVAKNPLSDEGEVLYDQASGKFVYDVAVSAVVNDNKAMYMFHYRMDPNKVVPGDGEPLVFALPHHIESLDPRLKDHVTNLQLRTTTKGMATAVLGRRLVMLENNLPVNMSFGPWSPDMSTQSKPKFPPEVLNWVTSVADRDMRRVLADKIPEDSTYYAGKALARLATIVWVIYDIVGSATLGEPGFARLKTEMARFVANKQQSPIYYDDNWKGAVSRAGFTNPGADFGNTNYNDHHFHYGYFVYAAAVIGALEPDWINQGDNKKWVNMLVKDFAESDYSGRDFPFSRCFDWYHGHSWAKGLYESADGKDQESTSEDGMASYAIKMWGKVIGDANMENRGNLMLAIQARTFSSYFYISETNTNHPPRFRANKVSGILFDNKVDYSTYFGTSPQLIHGIHMLPILPCTAYLRPRAFVKQEWEAFFSGGRAVAESVAGGWRGLLQANYAQIDPRAALAFFRDGVNGHWDEGWVDAGATRAWYLVWAAAMADTGKGKGKALVVGMSG